MSNLAVTTSDNARRIEELGRIIIAYSEVTEKLQQSHDQLNETVRALQSELGEKNRLLERKNRLAALGEMAVAEFGHFQMLRSQINPHFLFNSLNSISALTSIDASAARSMAIELGSFYRKTLAISARHAWSFARRTSTGTDSSSATSSTSRQKA